MAQQGKSFLVKIVGKTAVFCINGDDESRYRLEAYITGQMKEQGFDAYEGRPLIPPQKEYSAEELAELLLKDGFHTVVEVTSTGDVPKYGLPESLNLKFHSIPKPHTIRYSNLHTALDIALQVFIQVLISVSAR